MASQVAYTDGTFTQVHPAPGRGGACNDPGIVTDDEVEAILDAEWSSAAAPSAAIELASCANTTANFGGFIALQNILSNGGPVPGGRQYQLCRVRACCGASGNSYINGLYQLAVSESVSVFVRPEMAARRQAISMKEIMSRNTGSASVELPPRSIMWPWGAPISAILTPRTGRHILECDEQFRLWLSVILHPGNSLERLMRQ